MRSIDSEEEKRNDRGAMMTSCGGSDNYRRKVLRNNSGS